MTAHPLRGRAEELDQAREVLLRTASMGQGGVVLVSGEPGIGKTALLNAITQEAKRIGFAVGASKAEENDRIAPLAPVLVALRSGPEPLLSAAEFAELAPLYHQQLWLIDRLAGMLEERALRSPVLIAVDDVQWADPLSVFALRVAPGRLAGSPVVWLLAARPHPAKAPNDIVAAVARDVLIESVALGPLPPTAIDQIALDRRGAPPNGRLRELLEGARGFPFLAVELLDGFSREENAPLGRQPKTALRSRVTGERELPSKLIRSVRERLDSLPPDALRLVQVASVLGRSFSIEDAAALAEVAPWTAVLPSVAAAVRAGVLEDHGSRIAFRHDLLRQAVYEDVPPSTRIGWHRAAVDRFLAIGRSPIDAASHVLASADHGDHEAVDVLRRAAAAAVAVSPSVAAELIERAFSLLDSDDPAWALVGQEAMDIFAETGRTRDAVAIANQLLGTHLAAETEVRIQTRVSRLLWKIGDVENMRLRVDASLARSGISEESRAELVALRALILSQADDRTAATRAGQRALEQARRIDARYAEADALRALGNGARDDGYNDLALGYFQALRALVPATSPTDEIISLQLLDRYDASAQLIAQARAENEQKRDNSKALAIAYAQMWHNRCLGLIDEAEADARTLLQFSEDLQEQSYLHEARLMLCLTADHRGDTRAAREYLALAQDNPKGEDESWLLRTSSVRTWLAESEGDVAVAIAAVRDVFKLSPGGRHRWRWAAHWLMVATRIAVRGDDFALAREVAGMARVLAERNPNVVTVAGIAAYVDGLARKDVRMLRHAVDVLRASPRPLVLGDAHADLGAAELEAGRRDVAVAALDDAWEIFNRFGAVGKARRVQQLLQRAGVRRRHWTTAPGRPLEGWAALTETEARVARLIAEGHTNRSAAAQLFLSPNTVATHLRSIFGKLSVNSRTQLTRSVIGRRDETAAITQMGDVRRS